MKKSFSFVLVVILMLTVLIARSQDFTVTIPSTDPYQHLCKPVKAGASFNLTVSVKCNSGGPFNLSIDRLYSFSTYDNWFSIENNDKVVNAEGTVNFYLTISPPQGTDELDYQFDLYFNASDTTGTDHQFNQNKFVVIVDNSPPEELEVSISSISSNSVSTYFYAADVRSAQYTEANQSSGIGGIKGYDIILQNSIGQTIQTKYYNSTQTNYHTFKSLIPNTEYSVTVSAKDLADNVNTSEPIAASTAPRAPHNLVAASPGYCSVTLTWDASPGATSYRVWQTPSDVRVTTGTSYTFTGLTASTSYTFSVKAVSTAGESSASSSSTTTRPQPTISGPFSVCTTNTTFTLSNVPAGSTVSWTRSSNLAYVSGQGTGTYRVKATSSTTSGPGWVQAVVSGPCGDLPPLRRSVSVGPPARPYIRSGSSTQTGGSASYTLSLGEVTTSLQLFFEDPPGTASATGWEVAKTGSPQNFGLAQSGNTVLVTPLQVGTGQFTVRSYNACGESSLTRVYLTIERLGGGIINPPGWPIQLSPNPARGEVLVTLGGEELRVATPNSPLSAAGDAPVVVTSATGQAVFRGTLRDGALRLNVSGWQRGVYQVVVVHQGQRLTTSLVVE